jgi:hypothetical protein
MLIAREVLVVIDLIFSFLCVTDPDNSLDLYVSRSDHLPLCMSE